MTKLKQNIDYGYDIQKLYLEIMLTDAETFVRCQSIFDHELFDSKLQKVAEFMHEFVNKHNTLPTFEMVNASTNSTLENPGPLQESHYDWLLSEFETFSRHRALEKAILKSADLLEKSEYGTVEQLIKEAVQIGLQKDLGTNYWIDPRKRLEDIKNTNGQTSTGWVTLDKLLYGGMSRGELEIFAGSSGCVTGDTLVDVIRIPYDAPYSMEQAIEFVDCESVPIESLATSKDQYFVSSPDGFVRVTDCIQKTKNDMRMITFSTGEIISVSHDHLFQLTDNTWIYAKNLNINNSIIHKNGVTQVMKIVSYTKQTTVYDLSVDHHNHRYYTHGICSHNSGKSLFLANLGVNWVMNNLNVLYITCELSENLVSMRIDSMLTGIGTRDIFKRLDDIEMKITLLGKQAGAFQIKYMPSGSTINHIRSYLKEYEAKHNKKMDVIIVDYLDLIDPATKKISSENLFIKDKYVSEELRNLAMETNTILVTASQLNRSGIDEIEYDHSNISGGLSKINTADNVFGIFTSRAMRERGEYQLQLMKTRSSSGVGAKVNFDFNIETLRITDPQKDPSDNQNSQPSPNQIANVINRNSAHNGNSSGKGSTDSSKLREFLKNNSNI